MSQTETELVDEDDLFSGVFHDRGQDCWPDHIASSIVLDDVSRLNATRVHSLNQVRSIEDIKRVLKTAEELGLPVSSRGTKHSMGAHTLNDNGVVIDMKHINHMHFHPDSNTVTVGTGAMWSDLIQYLNGFAKSPRTLQSYCSFSLGGTMSVNGHGITTDYSLAESIVSFTLVKADGSVVECSRDAESDEARELFRHCIGGYGLFGVIFEATLKVKDNRRLAMDTIMSPINELPHLYDNMISAMQSGEIDIKLARIDITNFEVADVYLFRPVSATPTVSNLPSKPKEMSMASRTIYKWFAGPLREIRFAIEHSSGVALDWSEVNDSNLLLFESATPMAQLYSPWLLIDDTFILQEYFVPKANYNTWIAEAKNIILKELSKEKTVTLLNITIRYVHHDTDTALPYSATPGGSFAFVFYYRIQRTPEADSILESYHMRFTRITLDEGGTFYLPYRHHYTPEQLRAAYPGFDQFREVKAKHDPNGRFTNKWWSHYGLGQSGSQSGSSRVKPKAEKKELTDEEKKEIETLISTTEVHRTNSFRSLMKDPMMRQTFIETFLEDFLSLANNAQLMRIINTAIWDTRLVDDNAIYMKIVEQLSVSQGPLTELVKVWNQVKQLAEQKRELVRETVSVLSHIGRIGKVHDLVSIGDHGKLVSQLRTALEMQGKTWIVHDVDPDETDIGAALERGTINKQSLGTHIPIDYFHIKKNGREFSDIPDESVDLVTLNQGLHHLPPDQIPHFLQAVYRVLRPGGCFITREHDLDDNRHLIPMLDCAHMVFNALTGVKPPSERDEIRGFRSVKDWKKIIEASGFKDTMIYEMQPHDPTVDMMMCFRKTPFDDNLPEPERDLSRPVTSAPSSTETRINAMLNQAPHIALTAIKDTLKKLKVMIPQIQSWLGHAAQTMLPDTIPGLSKAVTQILNAYVNPMLTMLERFEPLTEAAIPKINTSVNLIPDELSLLIDILRARSEKSTSFIEMALVGIIDKIVGIKNEVIDEVKKDIVGSGEASRPSDQVKCSLHDEKYLKEIRTEFELLLRDIPEFWDIPGVIRNIGIPARGSDLLLGLLPAESSIPAFTKWVADRLDTESWADLKKAFTDIRALKQVPHIDHMKTPGSPWNRAATAILSSKTIQFTSGQTMMAGWVGLGDIVKIWTEAQDLSKAKARSASNRGTLTKPIIDVIDTISPVKTYDGSATILTNVMCIVSAKHVHYSITRLFNDVITDVTQEANEVLCLNTGTIDISEIRPKMKMNTFRAGSTKYIIEYRLVPDTSNTNKFKVNGNKLSHLLSQEGIIDGSYHANRDALNHYKLSEWMQVDMVKAFGDYMDHTPWYRFPFLNVLKSYFDVLFKEFSQVSQKTGFFAALGDQGFMTDLVPGVVMSIILGQMYLLALPLKKSLGDSYDPSGLFEHLVVLSPYRSNWSAIDARITSVQSLGHGLFTMKIPTFQPFTEVILKLARNSPLTTILQISNNISIQVKLETPISKLKSTLAALESYGEDIKVNFDYNLFPKSETSHPLPQQISVDVLIQSLISFIRFTDTKEDITIVQIYDFY